MGAYYVGTLIKEYMYNSDFNTPELATKALGEVAVAAVAVILAVEAIAPAITDVDTLAAIVALKEKLTDTTSYV